MYLVDLVGLENFNNATGIVNLFRGFGCFIGPYAAGNKNFKDSLLLLFLQ